MNWELISKKLQTLGKDRFVLLLLAGLMLVIIAMPTGNSSKKSGESKEQSVSEEQDGEQMAAGQWQNGEDGGDIGSAEVYRSRLCKQLEEFLQQIDGVGRAKVYITMHSSSEIIVERNSPYSKRTEEETTQDSTRVIGETENDSEVVLVEQEDGSKAPIVVKEITPVVEGVVVAAQGGGSETIKKEITELVMALFGIEEHKIRVVKLTT